MSLASRIASQLHSARTRGLVWALPHVVLGVFVLALFALLALLRQYERDARRAALAQDVQWAEQSIRSSLAENQAVEYDVVPSEKGPKAANVRKV